MDKLFNKGVPGLPQMAVDAIQDDNARIAIQALVDTMHVRNGSTGDGDSRFITKGELSKQISNEILGGTGGPFAGKAPSQVFADIQETLTQLENDIIASRLWADLGQKIQLVDIPKIFTGIDNVETVMLQKTDALAQADNAMLTQLNALGVRVGSNEAGLTGEVSLRVNSDNALASAVNKLWSVVGNTSALVSSGSQITSNVTGAVATAWNQVQTAIKDPVTGVILSTAAVRDTATAEANKIENRLTAERTIKVDVDGYVAGFGVIANKDMTTGATSSMFLARADTFAIGSASGGNRQEIVPFIVRTTTTVQNGKTVAPGVYMNSAVIGNGSITTAQIGVAAVDTLSIKGNAVTVPVGLTGTGSDLSVSVTLDVPGKIFVTYTANFLAYDGSESSMYVRCICDGVWGPLVGISLGSAYSGGATATAVFDVAAGTHTVSGQSYVSGGGRNRSTVAIFAMGCQR